MTETSTPQVDQPVDDEAQEVASGEAAEPAEVSDS